MPLGIEWDSEQCTGTRIDGTTFIPLPRGFACSLILEMAGSSLMNVLMNAALNTRSRLPKRPMNNLLAEIHNTIHGVKDF